MKTVLVVVLALVLVGGCGDQPAFAPLPSDAVVLAFGDSLTHGTGAAPGEDYPAHLAVLSGWQVINAGVPGDTAVGASDRLRQLLSRHDPQLVIIMLGGNDFLRQRREPAVKSALQALLAQVRAVGAMPVLVAVPRVSLLRGATGLLDDAALYAELADEQQVPLVSDLLSDLLSQTGLRSDQIHLNAEGYRQLAEGVFAHLREWGLAVRR